MMANMTPSAAKACARASLLAYEQPILKEWEAWVGEFEKTRTISGKRKDDLVVVYTHPLGIFIAFRGTHVLREWWQTNLNIFTRKHSFGRCHRGFSLAVQSLWDQIFEVAGEAHSNGQQIFVTGHSKGGAMALIASLRLIFDEKIPVAKIVTFAQLPVLFGTRFYPLPTSASIDYTRYVNCQDIGPMARFPFNHIVGGVCYFDDVGKSHTNWSFLRYFQDAFKVGWKKMHFLPAISMHSMRDYEKLV